MDKIILLKGNEQIEKGVEEIVEEAKSNDFYYFHRDSSYALLKELRDRLEEAGFQIGTFREVKYGLDEKDYLYELHII
jgi:hypothetical protein